MVCPGCHFTGCEWPGGPASIASSVTPSIARRDIAQSTADLPVADNRKHEDSSYSGFRWWKTRLDGHRPDGFRGCHLRSSSETTGSKVEAFCIDIDTKPAIATVRSRWGWTARFDKHRWTNVQGKMQLRSRIEYLKRRRHQPLFLCGILGHAKPLRIISHSEKTSAIQRDRILEGDAKKGWAIVCWAFSR